MIPLILALTGCHVFETVSIRCVSGMPCAESSGDDSGSDTSEDSGGYIDTGRDPTWTVGIVISMAKNDGSQQTKVQVYDAIGSNRSTWNMSDGLTGVVDFDTSSGNALVVGSNDSAWLYPYPADPWQVPGPDANGVEPVGVMLREGIGLGVLRRGIAELTVGRTEAPLLYVASEGDFIAAGVGPEGSLYIVREFGGLDLLKFTRGNAEPEVLYEGFLRSADGGRSVFAGPDGAPYVCSNAGQPYAVEALATGVTTPAMEPAVTLDDVRACAYDPGDDTWLAYSPTRGVYRFDRTGAVVNPNRGQEGQPLIPIPDTYTFLSGTFY